MLSLKTIWYKCPGCYNSLTALLNCSSVSSDTVCGWSNRQLCTTQKQRNSKFVESYQNEVIKDAAQPAKLIIDDASFLSSMTTKDIAGRINKRFFSKTSLPNLLSYAHVCVQNKTTRLAHTNVLEHHKLTTFPYEPEAVTVCNIVLHGWAKQMNYRRMNHLLTLMERDGPSPTLQSYAAFIECAARAGINTHLIQHILRKIKRKGFDLEDLFIKCRYEGDQREKVLQGIQRVLPKFRPKEAPLQMDYCCDLVQELNSVSSERSKLYSFMSEESTSQMHDLAKLQMAKEVQGQIKFNSILANTEESNGQQWTQTLKNCEVEWRNSLKETFEENLKKLKELPKIQCHLLLLPYLTVMPVDTYVNSMIQELIGLASSYASSFKPKLSDLHPLLGVRIMERYLLSVKKQNGILDKLQLVYKEFCTYYCKPELMSKYSPRQYWEILCQRHCNGIDIDYPDIVWSEATVTMVGQFLYKVLLSSVQIDSNILNADEKERKMETAFFSVFAKGAKVANFENVKPNKILQTLCELANCENFAFNTKFFPMLSPPRPWYSAHNGGFSVSSSSFIRGTGAHMTHSLFMLENTNRQDLFPAFDALTQHGECPWRVNEQILDLMIKLFRQNGSLELDLLHDSEDLEGSGNLRDSKYKVNTLSFRKRSRIRSDILQKLSFANQFRKHLMWIPHNVDFRGRIYPLPIHMTHIDTDIDTALMMFAKGEKIGKQGLQWLKIHLINLTGSMKRSSMEEKIQYCNENLNFIMDSADNPFEGEKWWTNSDKPWQTLACCIELTSALRCESPHDYISHFPIHQDGTTNVLQHYSALGCDVKGAVQANLYPKDAPQDAYETILNMVEAERAKDAAKGSEVAESLEGYLNRKVIKNLVMCVVYGIAAEKLTTLRSEASSYSADKTLYAVQQLFSSSVNIKEWLVQCATLLSTVCDQSVSWVSPLGFPVCQPYYETKTIEIQKENGSEEIQKIKQEVPNVLKQINSFAPNYIHSLESTHLMLTSLFCQRSGVTFASYHDSFWTLPSTVDDMNKICRKQFVNLYSQPLLPNLSKCMLKTQQNGKTCGRHNQDVTKLLTSIPSKGFFDLQHVLQSTYFFC